MLIRYVRGTAGGDIDNFYPAPIRQSGEGMTGPITVEIPHKLGRADAKQRLEKGVGKLTSFIPGSTVTEHHWDGDTLAFTVQAMGQKMAAKLDVFDDRVRAVLDLPPMLALFASKAKQFFLENGTKLLR